MSEMNRREWMLGVGALTVAGGLGAGAQEAAVDGGGTLGKAHVITPELKKMANGSERWAGFAGTTATGEAVGMHESVVPAGTPPPALHRIAHSELIVVMEGELEVEHDGVKDRVPTGSIFYVAYGTMHAVRNAGAGTARYFVFQVGGDTKKG